MPDGNYSIDQLKETAISYFDGDNLAKNVWISKYALKVNGEYAEISPENTIERIVDEIYRTELKFKNPLSKSEIHNNLEHFKNFIFGGSILFGLGNEHQISSLGNCFFIHNGSDSYGGILDIDQSMVQLMKRRGGVGITLEHLRPNNTPVNNCAQTSTGLVSFMDRYSHTTREVAQDGRRGALMISMHVNHPDIEEFIMKKDDLTKVTGANISIKVTDEFMKAVEGDQDYFLSWPIKEIQPKILEQISYNKLYKREDGSYIKKIRAKEIWNKIIKQAHKNAEPGILFWDTMINNSPADSYQDVGFKTLGTNPCISGDALISTADGRNAVSIKQLVEEGKDIPVYCLNDKGNVEIQLMRNPRITGYNQPIYEVKFDSGDSIKCIGNHKIRLKNGKYKEAKDLKYGDSLHISSISYSPIINKGQNYRWIKSGEDKTKGKGISEHRLIYEYYKEKIPKGHVIHHKDYNSLNNSINNLEMLPKHEHDILHAKNMIGKNNPYHKMTKEWKRKFASHPGLSNSRAYQISNEELMQHGLKLGKKLGRRFSDIEWIKYATENNLPKHVKSYRGFDGIINFSKYIASKLNFEYIDKDTRIIKRYHDALKNGYNAKITDNNILLVERTCEECNKNFWTGYDRREYATCSISCSNKYVNKTTDTNIRRTITINKTYKRKGEINKENQLRIFSELKFNLNREPTINEWFVECKNEKIPHRLETKYGFKSWDEVKEHAEDYNHKVISVELCGYENVYNGTVDKWHNFFTVFKPLDKINYSKQLIINQLNCGEVGLSSYDSCRLGSINLSNMIINSYQNNAKINWELLEKTVKFAQRVMDDIVTLEEEKVNVILKKIKNDPEPDEIKAVELKTWTKVLDILKKGRRTGVGVLGLGDMLAKLNIQYGSEKATKLVDRIFEIIAVNSYKESVQLAKERGAFPIWNYEKEVNNSFISRIISNHFNNKEYDEYVKYGRRNIANLSIAPTGSLAILAKTTSGIEPVFKIRSLRRKKINPNDPDVKIDFVDENGNSWEEYNVFHAEFINWFRTTKEASFLSVQAKDGLMLHLNSLYEEDLNKIIEKSPWAQSESHDIDYIEKVKMQGIIQKWIDHSISVTHNLPEKISLEEVNDIYFQAWKAGCKGCTIYREGSRTGILLSKKEVKFEEHHAPKRPKVLESDYYISKAQGREFAVIIGLWEDTNKPYEIFAFENPPMKKNCKGQTIRVGKGQYKFINGEFEIPNLELAAERKEERTLTLTASMLLRHGAPINHVIKVIKKIDEDITSFSSVVRRYLSRYIDAELEEEKCPECGGDLIREEACVHCNSCAFSKCL